MAELLQLESLSKAFSGLRVIEDVSFSVPKDARVALIGPNGAGKTTIFNLLCGVYAPDAGRIVMDGTDITALPSRRRVATGLARSFQNIRLLPHLSVTENVMLGQHSRARGLGALLSPLSPMFGSHWRREAEARLRDVGLHALRHNAVSELPYGIRKKIEVVRALMAAPRVLLLDEPAAGLNPSETAELKDFLLRVAAEGVALLVIEHDMSLVRGLCPHTVVLNFGRKIYDGPTSCVQDDKSVLEAYLGPQDAAATVSAMRNAIA